MSQITLSDSAIESLRALADPLAITAATSLASLSGVQYPSQMTLAHAKNMQDAVTALASSLLPSKSGDTVTGVDTAANLLGDIRHCIALSAAKDIVSLARFTLPSQVDSTSSQRWATELAKLGTYLLESAPAPTTLGGSLADGTDGEIAKDINEIKHLCAIRAAAQLASLWKAQDPSAVKDLYAEKSRDRDLGDEGSYRMKRTGRVLDLAAGMKLDRTADTQ